MRPKLYQPSPVLLPNEIILSNDKIRVLLLEYLEELCHVPGGKSPFRFDCGEILDKDGTDISKDKTRVRFLTEEEKLKLLKEPKPIYYDALLVNNKILVFGPYLPRMQQLIGKPKVYLTNTKNNNMRELKYYAEDFIPPSKKKTKLIPLVSFSYLVIDKVPLGLLDNPDNWELSFKYQNFEQKVRLQKNPFEKADIKLTLIALQKNQSLTNLANWCDHYASNHDVRRVVIYNNDSLNINNLPDLPIKNKIDIWYVEWNYSFLLYFTVCQFGAFTHANWWIKDATSYLLNFDPDEYLVNESDLPIVEYLKRKATKGLSINGYEVAPDIPIPQKHDSSMKNFAIEQHLKCTKYIYATNFWHILYNHSTRRYTFFINPAYWTMLNYSSNDIRFFIAKYCYKFLLKICRIFSPILRMTKADKKKIYFLHYRSINSNWKWKNDYYKRKRKSNSIRHTKLYGTL